jgi:hypothetical protein
LALGCCGLRSLTTLLNQQPEIQASYKELPFLTWRADHQGKVCPLPQ